MTIKNIPFGILLSLTALACLLSPSIMNRIGGVRTVVLVVILGTFFARYKKDDCPFAVAVRRMLHANSGMMCLLAWFYFVVIVSALRGGMGVLVEWKFHVTSILGLLYGLFLSQNAKYMRYAIYVISVVLLYHSFGANAYVSSTGMDMREALNDLEGMLGHTDYWTDYCMLLLLFASYLIKEKNKIIRIVGSLIALYLYKTVLLCGFATPVALFLIGHAFVGFAYLRYGKKGILQVLLRVGFALVLIVGSAWGIFKISTLEDDSRFSSIQVRFKNMIENPEGGGYSVEDSRFLLALISWSTFKQNPIFGCGGTYLNNPKSGGHHAAIDFLAIHGLLGGGAYIAFVILCVMNAYRRCRQERDWAAYSAFACSGIYLIVGLVNPGWYGGPMTILLLYVQPFKRPPRVVRPCPIQMLPDHQKYVHPASLPKMLRPC